MSLAENSACCHAPKLEQEQRRTNQAFLAWLLRCRGPCPETMPFAEFYGVLSRTGERHRITDERVTRSEDLPLMVIAARLREVAKRFIPGPKYNYPIVSFSHAKRHNHDSVPAVYAFVLDLDAGQLAIIAALFWGMGYTVLFWETSSSRIVTEKNPNGLDRWRALIPFTKPMPTANFKPFAKLLAQAISKHTGVPIDCEASANPFWYTGPRPSEDAPARIVDITLGFALDWEIAEKHLSPAPPAESEPPAEPTKAPKRKPAPAERGNPQAYFDKILSLAQEAIAGAPRGSRNALLNKQVYGLARHCNQGLSTDEIMRVARAGCEANGSWREDSKACLRTIKSAIKAGRSNPRYRTAKSVFDVVALREQALSRALAHGLKPREEQLVREIIDALDVVKGYSIIARETLAERTGLDVRTVARMVKRLEARGVVVVTHTKIQRPDKPASSWNAPNHYQFV